MNEINGIQPVAAPKGVESVHAIPASQDHSALGNVSDIVEISTAAILAARVHDMPEVRSDLIARIRDEIAAGSYETEERIDGTIDRLMDDLFPSR